MGRCRRRVLTSHPTLHSIVSSGGIFGHSIRIIYPAVLLAIAFDCDLVFSSSLSPRHQHRHPASTPPSSHHYWEGTYGEKPQKSAFTRFEGESARLYQVLEDQLKKQQQRGSSFIALDRPTIADFAFWSWTRIAGLATSTCRPTRPFRSGTRRWRTTPSRRLLSRSCLSSRRLCIR